MSEKRKPIMNMLIKPHGKAGEGHRVEVFEAQEWEETYPREAYRLRIDGKWFDRCDDDENGYCGLESFYTFDGIQSVISDLTRKLIDAAPDPAPQHVTPDMIPKGTNVHVFRGDWKFDYCTFVTRNPFQNQRGEWCCYVQGMPRAIKLSQISKIVGGM